MNNTMEVPISLILILSPEFVNVSSFSYSVLGPWVSLEYPEGVSISYRKILGMTWIVELIDKLYHMFFFTQPIISLNIPFLS